MSVTSKLVLLVSLALLFGATMIALSVKKPVAEGKESTYWGNEKNIEKSFSVKEGDRLILDADQGDVVVIGNDSQEMKIHISLRGSESLLKKYSVDIDQNGSTVTIRARQDKRMFHWFEDASFGIRYEVELPRKYAMKLETAGGNIELRNLEGDIHGETSGGDLKLEDVHGKVYCSTSGGDIETRKSTGELTLETSGGDIVCDELDGDTRVETSGGNINISKAGGPMRASTSGGDVRVELRDNKGIDLSTSGGNVTLTLPKSATGLINAETSGGEVSCDFPFSGKMQEGSLEGTINGGGERIHLESSGGDIVIHSVE